MEALFLTVPLPASMQQDKCTCHTLRQTRTKSEHGPQGLLSSLGQGMFSQWQEVRCMQLYAWKNQVLLGHKGNDLWLPQPDVVRERDGKC